MKRRKSADARDVLERASRGKYAIGAFNVSELITFKAIVNAAVKLKAPVIVETSPGETAFIGAKLQAAMLEAAEEQSGIPVLCNLDHAKSYAAVKIGMNNGYDMLHFDGSTLPLAKNRAIAKRVVREAHRKGLLVEGEMDHITGSSEQHRGRMEREQQRLRYTDPEAARQFVFATGVDIFAPYFGNVHGVFANAETLDLLLLHRIRERVPAWLSLHGGSGIRDRDVRRAIQLGMVKVNVNTELRIAFITALRHVLHNKREIAPYKLMPPVVAAVQRVVERKIRLFGSAGKA